MRRLHGVGVVLDVHDVDDLRAQPLDLGPDARLEPRAGRAADGLLDHDPDPAAAERRDPDDAAGCRTPASRAAASMIPASTTCGATLTLATRSPASTTWPSNTVKTSSGSSRLSRSSSATRTVTTPAVRRDEVEPALVRAARVELRARRRPRRAGSRRRPRGARRPPTTSTVTGRPGSAAASASRSSAVEPAALGPALAARPSGRGRGPPPTSLAGRAPTRSDLLDAHASGDVRVRRGGERGLDRAPRVDDRHRAFDSRDRRGCRSLTVDAVGGVLRGRRDAGRRTVAADERRSTAVARYATSPTPVRATLADARSRPRCPRTRRRRRRRSRSPDAGCSSDT